MKKHLYFCEIGVLLDEKHPEFCDYQLSSMPKEFAYYDENILTFLTKEQAYNYGKEYVENGIEKTYAFFYDFVANITDEELEDIEKSLFCEYCFDLSKEVITKFIYKENGEIKEYKLWKIER